VSITTNNKTFLSNLSNGKITMLLCVLLWSTSGLFIKFIDWHPMVISGLRSGIAALFMLLVNGRRLFVLRDFRIRSVPGTTLLLTAALTSAATKILYVLANKLTSSANAILLHHSAPVWAAFLGWLLIGEKPAKKQWASLVLICGGLVLFFANGLRGGSIVGDVTALGAGICFGASMALLRMNKDGSPLLCLFLSHCIPVVVSIPFIAAHPPIFTPANTASILFLGIFQVGIASLLYAYSIKRIRTLDAVFIAQLEPVLNPVWVFVFTGEIPAPLSIAGGVIIIAAVLLSQKRGNS
jgi:drug/metabolite transporter (DMT)-like permease